MAFFSSLDKSKHHIAAAFIVFVTLNTGPAFSQGTQNSHVIGIGTFSCATLPEIERNDPLSLMNWAGGFWSGTNWVSKFTNYNQGYNGAHTDVNGVVGEISLYCRNHPSETIFMAATDIYLKFEREKK